jgi:hypothetical protein
MMLDSGSSTWYITRAVSVGISNCCMFYVYCTVLILAKLTDFGRNLLTRILRPLHVCIVAWCCRRTQDIIHTAECPRGALLTSEWGLKSCVFTTWHFTGRFCSLFTEEKCLQQYLTSWFGCWTGITNKIVTSFKCYSSLCSTSQWLSMHEVTLHNLFHLTLLHQLIT